MSIKSIITLLLISNIWFISAMDRSMSFDITALHKSSLVITAKVIPGNEKEYRVVITEILKIAPGIVLNVGDEIKLLVPEWGSFGTPKRVYEPEYIFYLTPYKSHWFSVFGEQHIRAIKNDLIPFDVCNRKFLLNHTEYRQMESDFSYCFTYKNDYQYSIKTPLKKYKATRKPMAVMRELYECHSNLIAIYDYIDIPQPEDLKLNEPDTTIYIVCETKQGLNMTMEDFMAYMNANIPYAITNNELGIQGSIYIKFIIEPDGSGSNFNVVKGIDSTIDTFVLNLIKGLAVFKPGTIRGVAVRSYYIIPFRIRMK